MCGSHERRGQLKGAVHSNRRIGMAMGIVMRELEISDDEAFDALRRTSQNNNRKLRDVADDVIYLRRLWTAPIAEA